MVFQIGKLSAASKKFPKARMPRSKYAYKGVSKLPRTIPALKKALALEDEVKWVDNPTTVVSFPTTLSVSTFQNIAPVPIPQNDTAQGRDGTSVNMKSFTIRGYINGNPVNLALARVRIIVVDWMDTNYNDALADAGASILQDTTLVDSPYTMDPKYRHRVLSDKILSLGVWNTANPLTKQHAYNFSYRPKKHVLRWKATDTTGAQVTFYRGFVAAYIICDNFTAGGAPGFAAWTRTTFTE